MARAEQVTIPTIQEELRLNGSPKARFFTDEDRRAVTVEIPIHPDLLVQNEPINEPIKFELTELEQGMLDLLREDNSLTRHSLAEKLGCSLSTVKRTLISLSEKQMITREGSRKTGHWVVLHKVPESYKN